MAITYPATTKLLVKVELYLGSMGWTDVSAYVFRDSKVVIHRGSGPEDIGGVGRASTCEITFDNSDKRFSPRNVTGPYFGKLKRNTKVRVSWDAGNGYVQRYSGEIPVWTPKFPVGEASAMPITAIDVRERFDKGSQPLSSPIYNSTSQAADLVLYAPLEEGTSANGILLYNDQGSVRTSGTIDYGADTSLPGAKQSITLTATSSIIFNTGGFGFNGEWQVDWFMKIPSAPAANTVLRRVYMNAGTLQRFEITIGPTSYRVQSYNATTGAVVSDSGPTGLTGMYLGQWMHCRLMAQNTSSTQFQWQFVTFPLSGSGSFVAGALITGQVGNISDDFIPAQAGSDGISMAHSAIYNAYNFSAVDSSGNGYTGEAPTTRFLRICAEQGITAVVREGDADAVNMGPQGSDDFSALLREIVAANEGFVDTDTTGRLRLTSRTYLNNQAVALTVDYSAHRVYELVAGDEDRLVVNNFTASRSGGASVTLAKTTGTLNENDPDTDTMGIGRKPDSETYNLESDASLSDHASLRIYQGTIDEPYVDQLSLHFGRSGMTALLSTWSAMDTFQRIQITNPPTHFGADAIDMIGTGWTETMDQLELIVDINGRPASAFSSAVVEDASQRLDSDDTVLLHALTTTDTAIRVYNVGNEVVYTGWAHRDGDYPIRVSGEDITVTAVSTPTPTLVAAGTGASASSGSLTPGLPAGMQKGDLMLLFSSTRNNGTGTCGTPTTGGVSWARILDCDNMSLFGRIHTGSESAPTVPFINGAAGEDTLAQIAAFRNVSLLARNGIAVRLLASAIALNGSAQDIAFPPAATPLRASSLLIYMGWKKDDATSIATIGSPPFRIGFVSSTAGNDACMVWDYRVLTDVSASGTGGVWSVTGGAAAVSNSAVAFLDASVQLLTGTRSVNGAVVAHGAGEDVHVKYPIVLSI